MTALWSAQGDMAVVGPEVLEAVDADTPPSDLVYTYDVSARATTNGWLALIDNPQQRISTFTQHDVDSRRVVFLHNGSREPHEAIYLKAGTLLCINYYYYYYYCLQCFDAVGWAAGRAPGL